MSKDRASGKCVMLSVSVGFLMIVVALVQFIDDLLNGVVRVEVLSYFYGGAVMLIIGLLIFNCNSNKGAYSQPRNREIDDTTYLE